MKKLHYLFLPLLVICRSCAAARCAFLVCLLLPCNFVLGQSDMKLHKIKPEWKLGDQKIVHTASSTKIFVKDSLFNTTEATANYSIEVIDTVKNYTLLYSNEPNSMDIETKASVPKIDSAVNFFTDIIKKLEKETNSFKYELLVDKSTGQALKVKNSDAFLKTIQQFASTMIDELGEKMKKSSIQVDSIKQKVVTYFKSAEPKILETMTNQFNYIMQPYTYEFPYNSTISQKTMVHDVNALGEFGDVEIPATLTISSKKHDNILMIQTDTDYDKDFLLALIKKKYSSMSDLTASDIFLSEKEETTFTTTNGWVVSHKSNVVFTTKEVKVINETIVNFQ
ncbi:MAG: hypothetical protein QM737_23530 [Ferruginibacter sp.]